MKKKIWKETAIEMSNQLCIAIDICSTIGTNYSNNNKPANKLCDSSQFTIIGRDFIY